MSGWTRALVSGIPVPPSDSATASSAATAAGDSDAELLFLGQIVSPTLSQEYITLLRQLSLSTSETDSGSLQQTLIDRVRDGLLGRVDEASGRIVPNNVETIHSTLTSLGWSMNRLTSFELLPGQYQTLIDTLSWDLCDILLPALWTEWIRVTHATCGGGGGGGGGGDGWESRPIQSANITLFHHLLNEIVINAAPREVALSLLAFIEGNIRLDVEMEVEEEEEEEEDDENEDDDDDAEAETTTRSGTGSSSTTPPSISPFHRMSLIFPLLDLLSNLISRMSTPSSTPSSSSSSSSSSTPVLLTSRHFEVSTQVLGVLSQTLLHITNHIIRHRNKIDVQECEAWCKMHSKLLEKTIEFVKPVMELSNNNNNTNTNTNTTTTTPSVVNHASSLRSSITSFLFFQLFRLTQTYPSSIDMIQDIFEGIVSNKDDGSKKGKPVEVSNIDSSIFSMHLLLLTSLDSCHLQLTSLVDLFRRRRLLSHELEELQLQSWNEEGTAGDAAVGEDEDEIDPGMKRDDEQSSNEDDDDDDDDGDEDEDEQRYGIKKGYKPSKQQQQQSPIVLLKQKLKELPNYHVQGVGTYITLIMTYQYFFKIKPERKRAVEVAAAAADDTDAVDDDDVATTTESIDPSLVSLFDSSSDLGSKFLNSCLTTLSPTELVDHLSPFLAGLMFQGIKERSSYVLRRILTGLTTMWSQLPFESIEFRFNDGDGKDQDEIVRNGIWILSETLLQTIWLCPSEWQHLRYAFVLQWKNLLMTLKKEDVMSLISFTLQSCTVPTIQALIIGRFKELVVKEYEHLEEDYEEFMKEKMKMKMMKKNVNKVDEEDEEEDEDYSILSSNTLAMIHSHIEEIRTDISGRLDFLLALVNLFTFIVVKENTLHRRQHQDVPITNVPSPFGWDDSNTREFWEECWKDLREGIRRELKQIEEEGNEIDAQQQQQQQTIMRNQLQLAEGLITRLLEHIEQQ